MPALFSSHGFGHNINTMVRKNLLPSVGLFLLLLIVLFPGLGVMSARAQCFSVGTADYGTSTAGDWTDNNSWVGSSPGCNVGESDVEVDIDITLQSTSCSGNGLRITDESAKLNVVNNSTLTIEGDLELDDKDVYMSKQLRLL